MHTDTFLDENQDVGECDKCSYAIKLDEDKMPCDHLSFPNKMSKHDASSEHGQVKDFQCDTCFKRFGLNGTLRRHFNTIHGTHLKMLRRRKTRKNLTKKGKRMVTRKRNIPEHKIAEFGLEREAEASERYRSEADPEAKPEFRCENNTRNRIKISRNAQGGGNHRSTNNSHNSVLFWQKGQTPFLQIFNTSVFIFLNDFETSCLSKRAKLRS